MNQGSGKPLPSQLDRMIMLLFLAGSAAAAAQQSRTPATTAASATVSASVRLERALPVSAEQWHAMPQSSRRELQRTDEAGRKLLIRVIEHQ